MCAGRRRNWDIYTVLQLLFAFATTLFRNIHEVDWFASINFRDQAYLSTIFWKTHAEKGCFANPAKISLTRIKLVHVTDFFNKGNTN